MSYLHGRTAATREDWAYVRAHMPEREDVDDFSWPWLERHAGREASVLVLEEHPGAELVGFLVFQVVEGMLWVTYLYCRTGSGARHDWGLMRILSDVAEQFGVARIGMRSVRPGFARVLSDRLGLSVTSKVYTEFQITLPLLGEEARDGRQAPTDDGNPAERAAAC